MKIIFSAPEFILIVSALLLVLSLLNIAARLQRSIKTQPTKAKHTLSPGAFPASAQRISRIRTITVSRKVAEETLEEAS